MRQTTGSFFRLYRKALPFYLFTFLPLLLSCGVEDGQFKMEGEFKSFNQGELYVYTASGSRHQLDTIQVMNGRFSHLVELEKPTTFVIVFPNFSELPVFAEPGKTVKIEGDASHLKEMEVSGSDDNKQMTAFRMQTNQQTPPEVKTSAAAFIKENPQSPISRYILNKYFIQTLTPDYDKALELVNLIGKDMPNNAELNKLKKQLQGLRHYRDNGTLPKFTATDMNGKTVSSTELQAKVNIITTWASWNYDSQNMLRRLKRLTTEHEGQLRVISICLDANVKDCRRNLERDDIPWSNICDGRMWDTPLLTQLGLYFVPDNIITDSRGKILAHSVNTNEIDRKINELLK